MGYIKYQIEEKEVNFGDGNWYYTGEKRISDTIVGRYLYSGSCENEGETCYKLINRYNDGRTHAIRYDGYVFNSDISRSEFYPQTSMDSVFLNSGMTSAVIGDCVTCLNDITTVSPAISLTSLTIGDNVVYIGNNFFKNCYSLTSLSLPTKLLIIGKNAFQGCSGITSVTIPDSVITVGQSAFKDCISLSSITIGSGVTSIGSSAFTNSYIPSSNFINNSSLDAEANNYWGCVIIDYNINGLCIKDNRVIKYIGNDTNVVIPNSVTSIGDKAFYECTSLTSVTIPNSVTSIGVQAFYDCSSFTSVTIPNSVTSIGNYAFCGCSGITSIDIPDSVEYIGNVAFGDCYSLTNCIIGSGATSISSGAFYDCNRLTTLSINSNAATNGVFSGMSSLESVVIGNKVTSIGTSAFTYCSGFTSITIPASVRSISHGAFTYCRGLTSIICNGPAPSLYNMNVFFETNNCPIYVPAQRVDEYKKAGWWHEYASRIQPIPDS